MTGFWRAAWAGTLLMGMLPMAQGEVAAADRHVVAWRGAGAAWQPAEPHIWTLVTDGAPAWPGRWRRPDPFRWTTEPPSPGQDGD